MEKIPSESGLGCSFLEIITTFCPMWMIRCNYALSMIYRWFSSKQTKAKQQYASFAQTLGQKHLPYVMQVQMLVYTHILHHCVSTILKMFISHWILIMIRSNPILFSRFHGAECKICTMHVQSKSKNHPTWNQLQISQLIFIVSKMSHKFISLMNVEYYFKYFV